VQTKKNKTHERSTDVRTGQVTTRLVQHQTLPPSYFLLAFTLAFQIARVNTCKKPGGHTVTFTNYLGSDISHTTQLCSPAKKVPSHRTPHDGCTTLVVRRSTQRAHRGPGSTPRQILGAWDPRQDRLSLLAKGRFAALHMRAEHCRPQLGWSIPLLRLKWDNGGVLVADVKHFQPPRKHPLPVALSAYPCPVPCDVLVAHPGQSVCGYRTPRNRALCALWLQADCLTRNYGYLRL